MLQPQDDINDIKNLVYRTESGINDSRSLNSLIEIMITISGIFVALMFSTIDINTDIFTMISTIFLVCTLFIGTFLEILFRTAVYVADKILLECRQSRPDMKKLCSDIKVFIDSKVSTAKELYDYIEHPHFSIFFNIFFGFLITFFIGGVVAIFLGLIQQFWVDYLIFSIFLIIVLFITSGFLILVALLIFKNYCGKRKAK